ncbi:hypothetical protein HWV62_33059 [Athelia sp. TMB]|nr:hypothetical protein HWV62_33059 [Athelia sp. TMB]
MAPPEDRNDALADQDGACFTGTLLYLGMIVYLGRPFDREIGVGGKAFSITTPANTTRRMLALRAPHTLGLHLTAALFRVRFAPSTPASICTPSPSSPTHEANRARDFTIGLAADAPSVAPGLRTQQNWQPYRHSLRSYYGYISRCVALPPTYTAVPQDNSEPTKPPRKGKDHDQAPPDLAARMISNVEPRSTRPKERIERALPPSSPSTSKAAPEPSRSSPTRKPASPQTLEADPEDFSRRLNISSTKRPSHTSPRPSHNTAKTKLFDHRKDDPVRFSVMARPSSTTGGRPMPTPKPSADYVSASSTSSYAHSIASSSFTLSSGTTESSASSAVFERRPSEGTGNSNAFAVQLKKLYRGISSLETRILNEDVDDSAADEGRVLLKSRAKEVVDEDAEKQKWRKLIDDHKRLAEMMHNLLEISLAPSVPASLRNIPTKYNIIIRLWTHAFHRLLESLRRASFTSPLALEHLQDFIYYAYTFYTGILEEQTLRTFRAGWLEALGDLARYRMAVAAMVTGSQGSGPEELTAAAVAAVLSASSPAPSLPLASAISAKSNSISGEPPARIDDPASPSVGISPLPIVELDPRSVRTERASGSRKPWVGLQASPAGSEIDESVYEKQRIPARALGEAAKAVMQYLTSHLTSLNIRTTGHINPASGKLHVPY